MTVVLKATKRSGRGVRRLAAAAGAIALAFTGALAVGTPAFAAEAPAAVTAEVQPIEPIEGVLPPEAVEAVEAEPISEVIEAATPPVGLTVFLVSALTVGAGGIATARVLASRRQAEPARSRG